MKAGDENDFKEAVAHCVSVERSAREEREIGCKRTDGLRRGMGKERENRMRKERKGRMGVMGRRNLGWASAVDIRERAVKLSGVVARQQFLA